LPRRDEFTRASCQHQGAFTAASAGDSLPIVLRRARRSHKERRNHLFSHFIIVAGRFLFISAAETGPVLITGPDREHIPIWERAHILLARRNLSRTTNRKLRRPKNGGGVVYRDVRMNVSFIGARQNILFALKYGRAKSYLLCVPCAMQRNGRVARRRYVRRSRKSRRRGRYRFYSRPHSTTQPRWESENVSVRVHSLIYGAASVLQNNPCSPLEIVSFSCQRAHVTPPDEFLLFLSDWNTSKRCLQVGFDLRVEVKKSDY